MALNLPPCPQTLKSIQHYLKTAAEHEQRDVIVAYWCRLYALQTALKIDRKSEDARILLSALMDWLENTKKSLSDNEAIANEVAAQAHLENYALKLFTWADSQDRAGVFNKNVWKAFYSAGMLMDVLTTFGEQTDEIAQSCKYAKWKAAYIHNCLKNGETPIPGPMNSENDPSSENFSSNTATNIGFQMPSSNLTPFEDSTPPVPAARSDISPTPFVNPDPPSVPAPTTPVTPTSFTPATPSFNPTIPSSFAPATPSFNPTIPPPATSAQVDSDAKLDSVLISKAQKYCKFAGSALNYDDIPEAIKNLEKALHILRTGQDL